MGVGTDFLVRVTDAAETAASVAGGADRIGLSDARGALSRETVATIVAAAGGCPVSGAPAVLGPGVGLGDAAGLLADVGVAMLELPASDDAPALLATVRQRHPAIGGLVAYPAASAAEAPKLGVFAERGFQAAGLAGGGAEQARLIDAPGIEGLERFVHAAHRRGLQAWIAGSLEAPDVPRMLALDPDVLAFRASLCGEGRRDAPLDPDRVAMMRALIPRAVGGLLPPRSASMSATRDTVFVRDFVVEAGVGAYRYEHRQPQRMRFTVEAELVPIPDTVADMRDVFSYDVIVDAIRLATRRHVILVERVALDVAAATLRDARVRRVKVRIEKLDIVEGAIGVEIERERAGDG